MGHDYILSEYELLKREKWIEGIKRNNDPGDEFAYQWIQKNGEWFRQQWKKYNCSKCNYKYNCPNNFKNCPKQNSN